MELIPALVLLFGCALISVPGHASDLPSGIEKCAITDEQCLVNGVNYVLRNYAQSGIKQLGLIPLDPLHIKKFKIARNPHSPVNIDLSFHEVDLLGLQQAVAKRVSGFKSDLGHPIELVMSVPEIVVKGPYSVDGRVLILPITGKGNAEIKLSKYRLLFRFIMQLNLNSIYNINPTVKTKVRALIKFRRVSKGDHQTFAEVVDIKVDIDPAHVTYHLENLFNGQKDLSENMHVLINENWQDIFTELKPGIGEAFALIAKAVLDRIFGKLPLEQLFLA
ncbi:protein takeout isoform X1 [Drosophila ficusphila]|uniref:protein takeout isoform X1 n=1 Tax=Drosophila ficusphila TaxID=30025 RepID=UPI0007E7E98D|nr:protein takeout isoform X1 [Drosophila ficusphila]